MALSLKKFWAEYGVPGVLGVIVVAYILYMMYKYLTGKGSFGSEMYSQDRPKGYNDSSSSMLGGNGNVQPAQEHNNELYSSISGSSGMLMPQVNSRQQNPSELLPKDNNGAWAELNPSGQGDLAGINLLKAGANIGINTIGQSFKNPNMQIRSEPPNPQVNTGPWNLSTIDPDFMRPTLEIGQGMQ